MTPTTIVVGVDASPQADDAIAFAGHFPGAHVILASAFPIGRAAGYAALRDAAFDILEEKSQGRSVETRAIAETSPAHALHDLGEAAGASLIVVGSTHTGRLGRVVPGSTGEKLLHGSPCAVAVVPREWHDAPFARIGVGYNGSDEAKNALAAAVDLARISGAEIELIGVAASEWYTGPAMVGGVAVDDLREEVEAAVQANLDAAVAEVPGDVRVTTVMHAGDAAEVLAAQSEQLDLIVIGSRGYGPLRSVLVGGVSGRLVRAAHCPVIVVPRGTHGPRFAPTPAAVA